MIEEGRSLDKRRLSMKDILKVVFVIIGSLIGAGFASGQEIYLFFFSYGIKGIIGIIVSSILMGVTIYKTLTIVHNFDVKNYKEYLEVFIRPKKEERYFNLKNIINTVINIFILITFFIMIAGFGAYFGQELGISNIIGSIILAALSFIVLITSVKGVIKVNEILVPILIIFIISIGILNLKNIPIMQLDSYIVRTNNSNYILSAILYCSYNSILLIPVLITLKDYIKNRKQIGIVSIITTIITIILSVMIFLILAKVDVDIAKLEMPAVYVVSNMFNVLRSIYGFIILGAIFTTAISLGNSFIQNISKNRESYPQIALIMCIISVLVSKIGFSNLINFLYPIFGYLGLIQILGNILKKTSKTDIT